MSDWGHPLVIIFASATFALGVGLGMTMYRLENCSNRYRHLRALVTERAPILLSEHDAASEECGR